MLLWRIPPRTTQSFAPDERSNDNNNIIFTFVLIRACKSGAMSYHLNISTTENDFALSNDYFNKEFKVYFN